MKWWKNTWFSFRDWFSDWSKRFSEERSSLFSTSRGRVAVISFIIGVLILSIIGYYLYQMYLIHDYRLRAQSTYDGGFYSEAIKNYEALAELGDEEGLFKAAEMYLEGIGIPKDQKKAIEYLHIAADLGSSEAMTKLGMLYYASSFINRTCLGHDYRKALEWFQKAGKNPDALEALATMYQKGLGVEKNEKIAQNYFDEWINVYAVRAQDGDAKSQYLLGLYYSDGVRHSVDEEKSLSWYEKSAAQGYIPALEVLAFTYTYGGEKIQKNPEKAKETYEKLISLYEKNAEEGKVDSLIALSSMYMSGIGVEKNTKRAVEYLERAIGKNSPQALDILADLIEEEGITLENNETPANLRKEANDIRESEATRGNISMMKELGYRALSENHESVDPATGMIKLGIDYTNAIKWFTQAAQAGDAPAMLELGQIYDKTKDNSLKSLKLAEYWYKKSAEQCYEPAYLELGDLYNRPNTEFENAKIAQSWYELSATQGTQNAQLLLAKSLASGGKGAQPDYLNALKWLLVVKHDLEDDKENREAELKEINALEKQYSHYLTDEEIENVKTSALNMYKQYGTEW
ncbi:MAG: tetratricopeptide repeat protein [Ruminobacter sp.]|nr:tetratricopeptide repeat protein [Ruminobacter sp.]